MLFEPPVEDTIYEWDDDYQCCGECSNIVDELNNNLCARCIKNIYNCKECNKITFYDDLCKDTWCYLKWKTVYITYMDGADYYGPKYYSDEEEVRLSKKEFHNLYEIQYRKSLILERILLSKINNIFDKLPKDLLKIINTYVFNI